MKVAVAVVFAIVVGSVGWMSLGLLLSIFGYIGMQAAPKMGIMALLYTVLSLLLCAGFGGFVATYVAPRIFSTVDPRTITTAFISAFVTLAILGLVFSFALLPVDGALMFQTAGSIVEAVAVVIGAKLGGAAAVDTWGRPQ